MRSTLLVAWREYKQYVFTRGFLLFLVMLPIVLVVGTGLLTLIEKARPVRHFVVYDMTGEYEAQIDVQLAKQRARSTLAAWDFYLETSIDRTKIKPEELPFPFGSAAITNKRLDAFTSSGGASAAADIAGPYLKNGAPTFVEPKERFVRATLTEELAASGAPEAAAEILRPYLLGEEPYPALEGVPLFAAIIIPEGFSGAEGAPQIEFWSASITDPALEIAISRAISVLLRREAAAEFGLSEEDLKRLADVEAPIQSFRPDRPQADAALDRRERLETAILPGILTYSLLVVVFAVGNPLLTNTIEERSNKIVEVLLSSVTADQLMFGKLIGIACVGLTMPTVFLLGAIASALTGLSGGDFAGEAIAALFRSNLLPVFVFYFLSAYFIFAMIFLAIGALSNTLQDAQTYMGPLMIIVFAPMPFVVMMFQNPNGLVASILTWIPIYTPYAVMMRIASDPPMWEIIGATILMLVFALILARYMGRIFKNSLLNASPPKAKEIWRLAKA